LPRWCAGSWRCALFLRLLPCWRYRRKALKMFMMPRFTND
jgi:hypothetical protein